VTRETGRTAHDASVAIDFDYAIAQDIHSEPTIEWAIALRCARHEGYVPSPMDLSTFQRDGMNDSFLVFAAESISLTRRLGIRQKVLTER
jgi:hypothetical protein